MTDILRLEHLRVAFEAQGHRVDAVADASIRVPAGGAVGLVGESGSGKSTLARTLMGLLTTKPVLLEAGLFCVDGKKLSIEDPGAIEQLRGKTFAMVFQDPLSYLNPIMRVGRQIKEAIVLHDDRRNVGPRLKELLDLVHLPQTVADAYPHELSGGMRQRALLAIALACRPRLLLADEPTTALDVTTQMEILGLLRELRRELGMALLLISHDLVSIAELCDEVYVMYQGRTIENGTRRQIFNEPSHAYTKTLLAAARASRATRQRVSGASHLSTIGVGA
jgi:ABC-type dipeptide/oligopeptide/nickel transport system ATPase component